MTGKKMDEKKLTQSGDTSTTIKTTAVDTGRRIEVGTIPTRPTVIRRGRDENVPRHQKKRFPVKEKVEAAPAEAIEKEASHIVEAPVVEAPARVEHPRIPLFVEPTEFDESGDFAALLAESEQKPKNLSVKLGDKVSGTIIHIGKDHSFVSLDAKLEVAIATAELLDQNGQPKFHMGDKISAYVSSVTGGITISNNVAQSGLDDSMLQEALAKRIPVEGKVTGVNKARLPEI